MEHFAACFAELEDRRGPNVLHELREIVFIALLATLCGATNCCDMALFARFKAELLRTVLKLKHGLPSHDTFSRVFRMLDPKGFERAFQRFMQAFCAHLQLARPKGVVALDGKALRCAYQRGQSYMPALMVSAWGAQTRMALANVWAQDGNEATAVRALIELLQLKDCIVTADALHCRRDTAAAIIAQRGDYVLAVKDNQPKLLRAAKRAIAAVRRRPTKPPVKRTELSHGRKDIIARELEFPGLKAFAMIRSKRAADQTVERYFLLSQHYRPGQVLKTVREHWGIENRLHWTLDVVLDEDRARNRKDNAPANLAVLRRLALNIARGRPRTKALPARQAQARRPGPAFHV